VTLQITLIIFIMIFCISEAVDKHEFFTAWCAIILNNKDNKFEVCIYGLIMSVMFCPSGVTCMCT
jgi:hypothetical protein